MQLGGAMLFVKDLAKMREFYSAMLGAGPVNTEWTASWALFETGGARFALHAIPEEAAGEIEIASPPRVREQAAVKLMFQVSDVPAERARLESLGAAMLQREWQDPQESCDGVDPEGNVFQITKVAR